MHRVTVLPDGVCLPGHPGETILDTVVRGGFRYSYACRRGGCATCKVQLAAGRVAYPWRIAATVLSEEERAAGLCLSCRAVPDGDVEIRLQQGDRLRCVSPIRFGQQGVTTWV